LLVNIATLKKVTERGISEFDIWAFQMPTAHLLGSLLAVLVVGAVSRTLCVGALRGRVRRG